MSEAVDGATPSRPALQPFTFSGLAAFGRAGLIRLLVAQLLFAALASGSVVYFLQHTYAPVILRVIQEIPETAKITRGRLVGIETAVVAESKFLAIALTPVNTDQIGQSADLQVQLRTTDFRIGTVFRPDWGLEFNYEPGAEVNLSRASLEPWWGAWNPVFLAYAGAGVVVLLFVIWAVLALIYTLPAKIISWYADRQLSFFGAWRIACAALLPGALLMVAAIWLYGLSAMDLLGLSFFFVAHFMMGWVYLTGAVLACPKLQSGIAIQNPFTT